MPLWPQFIGGAYRARSGVIANDLAINVFRETTQEDSESKQGTFYGTPGLHQRLTTTGVSCRGIFSQDGRTFVVMGDRFYEIDTITWTATDYGQILTDGKPVSIASNGRGGEQLAIVGGGQLKIFDLLTNTLSAAVVLPLTNDPVIVVFIDGYFVLLEADTIRVWFSALEDGTSWDALDFFARSETSDNLIGMVQLRNRLWIFGTQTSEVYYNTGDNDTPFQPYPGTLMQEGASSAYAISVIGETVIWLAQDNQGKHRIVIASDYEPATVSTPAISYAIAQYDTVADAEVLVYEQEGHQFAIFTFPSGNATWAFDVTEKEWHQRAAWDTSLGQFYRWRARGAAATDGGVVVGDFETGDLYTLDLDLYEDNGDMVRRLRRAPYLSSENQWLFVDQFELGMEAGVGLASGQGSDPVVELNISRDNGKTWESAGNGTIGAMGEYETRAMWTRLGRSRSDRLVFEVVQTDPVKTVWGPGAWLRVTPGSGAL